MVSCDFGESTQQILLNWRGYRIEANFAASEVKQKGENNF